jgi:light-regulated signal transduction histidine kinase (bacteriophytochrome)
VKDAAGDLEAAIRNVGAHVEIGPLPIMRGDPYQLRQVFQNLIITLPLESN